MKLASFNPYALRFLSLGTIIAVITAIWAFYPSDNDNPSFLPVIQASSDPVRTEPNTNQNIADSSESRIYETFKAGKAEQNPPRIENLLSVKDATEQSNVPSREELFAGLKPEINVRAPQFNAEENDTVSITESPPVENNEPTEPAAVTPNKISVIKQQDTQTSTPQDPERVAADKPTPTPIEKTVEVSNVKAVPGIFARSNTSPQSAATIEPAAGAAMAPKIQQKKPTFQSGNHFVQLASIQDVSKTQQAWRDLKKKYDILQNAAYRTQNANIAGKGIFYRIQAGPFSKASAEDICARIKSQSGSCFVTSK